MKLFNTLGREKQEFEPIGDVVGFYACGPTVYWTPHIGNMRTYIFNDILKRVLLYNDFKIKHVMNYTDVGHLTSDADEGEDKIEAAAKKENKTAKEISEHYAAEFDVDSAKLNILPPDVGPKATEHIPEQIELIKNLEKKGFTYQTSDGVYFDTSKLPDYGKLDPQNLQGLEGGKRVDLGEKKNKTDFALWKFSETPGVRQQEWESPWGVGYPGWHLECSAMSSKYLGNQFDIHTGGEDHIQIHHTNEIAQSEAAFEQIPWVKYWMHGSYLTFKGEKVSKSKGGLFTLAELEERGFDALDFRYLCLNTHYRKQLSFSIDVLEGARNTLERLKNIILDLKNKDDSEKTEIYEKYQAEFREAVNDDLNMPRALSVIWEVLRDKVLGSTEKLKLAYDFDRVLGLGLKDLKEEKVDLDNELKELLKKREKARVDKDYETADKVRDELKEKGYAIDDTPDGPKLHKL